MTELGIVYPRRTFPDGSAVVLGKCLWRTKRCDLYGRPRFLHGAYRMLEANASSGEQLWEHCSAEPCRSKQKQSRVMCLQHTLMHDVSSQVLSSTEART